LAFIWSFIIAGAICIIGQLLTEMKVPQPLIMGGVIIFGGIISPFGMMDKLSELGAGGINIVASGLGGAGFGTAIALCNGVIPPLFMVLVMLTVLLGLGALSGNIYYNKYPEKVTMPPMPDYLEQNKQHEF
jgi:hypothetical protein